MVLESVTFIDKVNKYYQCLLVNLFVSARAERRLVLHKSIIIINCYNYGAMKINFIRSLFKRYRLNNYTSMTKNRIYLELK